MLFSFGSQNNFQFPPHEDQSELLILSSVNPCPEYHISCTSKYDRGLHTGYLAAEAGENGLYFFTPLGTL